MKSIERRLGQIEAKAIVGNFEFEGMTAHELDALIRSRLTRLCRDGLTLEQISEALLGVGYGTTAKTIADKYVWDPDAETVRGNKQPRRSHMAELA